MTNILENVTTTVLFGDAKIRKIPQNYSLQFVCTAIFQKINIIEKLDFRPKEKFYVMKVVNALTQF